MSLPDRPQGEEAERALLGAMLIEEECRGAGAEGLRPEEFSAARNGEIFRAILILDAQGSGVDPVTVHAMVTATNPAWDKLGTIGYLRELLDSAPHLTRWHAEEWCAIIRAAAQTREVVELCERTAGELSAGKPLPTVLENIERTVCRLQTGSDNDGPVSWDRLMAEVMKRAEAAIEGKPPPLIPTGIVPLDLHIGGLRRGDSIVIAGRPSMGKSALITQIAAHVSTTLPVLVFSIETEKVDAAQNIICRLAAVQSSGLNRGKLTIDGHSRMATAASIKRELWIDSTPAISMSVLRSRARRFAARYHGKIGLLAVDFLQHMTGTADSREERVAENSRALKALARELDVPLLLVAQLNRKPEGRDDKRPMLSDLRESGGIEQDADMVLLLYRPGYYKDKTQPGSDCDLDIAKWRNGNVGEVKLSFIGETLTFGRRQ